MRIEWLHKLLLTLLIPVSSRGAARRGAAGAAVLPTSAMHYSSLSLQPLAPLAVCCRPCAVPAATRLHSAVPAPGRRHTQSVQQCWRCSNCVGAGGHDSTALLVLFSVCTATHILKPDLHLLPKYSFDYCRQTLAEGAMTPGRFSTVLRLQS